MQSLLHKNLTEFKIAGRSHSYKKFKTFSYSYVSICGLRHCHEFLKARHDISYMQWGGERVVLDNFPLSISICDYHIMSFYTQLIACPTRCNEEAHRWSFKKVSTNFYTWLGTHNLVYQKLMRLKTQVELILTRHSRESYIKFQVAD